MNNFYANEKDLLKNEDRFHALFDSITDALLVHWVETDDERGNFIEVNDVACQLLGYTREELLDMTPSDINAPDSGVDVASITQKLEFGKKVLFEQTCITRDGRRIPVEINSRIFIFDGRPAVISLVRDITERRMSEEILHRTQFSVDKAREAIFLVKYDAGFAYVNDAACRSLGYTRKELLSLKVFDIDPEFPREAWADYWHKNRDAESYMLETLHKTKDGRVFPVEVALNPMRFAGDECRCAYARDITERRITEKKMKELSTAVEQSSDWILITNTDGKIEYVNNAVERMSGYKKEEILNKTPSLFKSGKYDNAFYKGMWNTILSGQTFSGILTNRRKNGEPFEIFHTVTPIRDDNGKITRFVATSKDITALRQMEERINFLANYDDLTKLPNRTLFTDRLMRAVSRAEHTGKKTAVLFIDIDRFHLINDTLGLNVGDACLKEIAERLLTAVREGDIVARFGSDEFAVALIDVNKSEDVILFLENTRGILSVPIKADGEETVFNFSIGISIYRDDSEDIITIIQNADIACQKAKEQGGNTYQFFTLDMNVKASEFILMERNLFNAIKNNEFILHYQPYFNINTRKMVGMEALIRWQKSCNELVPPGSFIPVLEKNGMIIEVGEWVLLTAIRQIKEWQNRGYPVVPVSVNLSLVQFRQKNLAETIKNLLEEFKISPSLLVLEITESAFMEDIQFTKSTLEELKNIGLSISIDDFGTGYSSLSYLKRFPVDNLKIDISFVREIAKDPDTSSIVSAIVTMADALNLKTIAEGIETEAQLGVLQDLKCSAGQGFYFRRPMPAASLETYWLENFME